MTTDTPSQGTGLADAATRIEAILSGDTGKQTPEAAESEAPADEDLAEALASEAEDETPPETDGAEDQEASAEDDGAEEAANPQDQLVTVKIDGKETQIPLKEALNGYQRQADYSRKTAALAEDRKAIEAAQQQVMAERAQYAQLLGALQQQLVSSQPQEPNWEKLYAEDPLEYVRQKDVWRERGERLQAIAAEQQRVAAVSMQEQSAQLQNIVASGRETLKEMVPAWKDQARWDADRNKIKQYLQDKFQAAPEEIAQVYDPRLVMLAYKAMRLDEIMAKRPAPNPSNGPKPAKAGAPSQMQGRRTTEITKAKQRLAQTGSVSDAAKIFERLL